MKLRISPSLLDSFNYYLSIEDEAKSFEARVDILNSLRGIPVTSEKMEKGLKMENDVVACVTGRYEQSDDVPYDKCVLKIAEAVKGSIYQYRVERELDGVILHGYIDFLHINTVIDLKTTANYSIGKYQKRSQHLAYLYCTRDMSIDNFTYLVTDFRNVYKEDYVWQPDFEDRLKANISAWFDYLENDTKMKQAYFEKCEKKHEPKQKAILLRSEK